MNGGKRFCKFLLWFQSTPSLADESHVPPAASHIVKSQSHLLPQHSLIIKPTQYHWVRTEDLDRKLGATDRPYRYETLSTLTPVFSMLCTVCIYIVSALSKYIGVSIHTECPDFYVSDIGSDIYIHPTLDPLNTRMRIMVLGGKGMDRVATPTH